MRHFSGKDGLLAIGVFACLAGPMMADSEMGVVVELYTSQGCSSCPPADDLLADLSKSQGVIPLALHVDYWDYIGWADTFGNARYTTRQKAYAHAAGEKMIYTPQMIVGGADRVEGNQPSKVAAAIRKAGSGPKSVSVSLERKGGQVAVSADATGVVPAQMQVQLVRYRAHEDVAIGRGENAGLTQAYHNIVTSWSQIGEWNGSTPLRMNVDAPGGDGVVVIIQSEGPGAILGAARLK